MACRGLKEFQGENLVDYGLFDRLGTDELVDRPLELSLADLRKLPSRTQITRHDCVEGWSAIGKWTGIPLGLLLRTAGLRPNARFAVFHCADELERSFDGSGRYYESIDLIDAFHPQTILAYSMNDEDLCLWDTALHFGYEWSVNSATSMPNTLCVSRSSKALAAYGAATAVFGKIGDTNGAQESSR